MLREGMHSQLVIARMNVHLNPRQSLESFAELSGRLAAANDLPKRESNE